MEQLDLKHLLQLRLLVARCGEMDNAQWWNTQGVLGKHGRAVYARSFPKTHVFVRARLVFAVARARCRERFDPPASITLWTLPAEIEDDFNTQWESWLEEKQTRDVKGKK